MRAFLFLMTFVLTPCVAAAGQLAVTVKDATGQPVANAVVTFAPAAGGRPAPAKEPGRYVVTQTEVRFDPFVIVVPVGAEVDFPNKDKVRHHVYSFSPAKKFELKLYGRDETRHVTFDQPGVVALGCNIHDQMMGFVFVADTPYVAKSGANGEVVLDNLPAGPGVITVWHPFQRSRFNQSAQSLTVPAQGQAHAAFSLNVKAPPPEKTPLL
jgi:plastocyanin